MKSKRTNGIRRASFHNYSQPGYYMLTMTCLGRRQLFGTLVDNTPASPKIDLSPLGLRLVWREAKVISEVYPMVRVRKFMVMPDHLHIILQVLEPMPDDKDLGDVVNGFKVGCRRAFRDVKGYKDNVFEEGYNDRLLFCYEQLQAWYHYLDDNPRRLSIKRRMPELFKVRRRVPVYDHDCDVVGNVFLLDIPDKRAVIVHRADDNTEFERKKAGWLRFGEAGGVLVSAAISQREKQVMREAINRGYSMIIVRNEGMSNFYKPSGEAFDACASGQLLQVAPFPDNFSSKRISRQECLFLNDFATGIAASSSPTSTSAFIHGH